MKKACLVALMGVLACSSTDDSRSGVDSDNDPSTGDGDGDGNNDEGGDGDGDGDGDGGDGDGDGEFCEEHGVRSDRVTPDILIVLDRSGSMDASQNGGVDRWGGSRDGVKAITEALDTTINFGLMTFPSDEECGTGSVNVPVGPETAGAIAQTLDAMDPNGATPTRVSLEAARDALLSIVPGPDEVARPKYVLLVTDGAPNCEEGSMPPIPDTSVCLTAPDPFQCITDLLAMAASAVDQAAVDATVSAIQDLAADGVKTYVIGYSTQNVANLAAALDMMAAAGNTGDTQHRPVENRDNLVQEFEEIAGVAVSCEFVLDEAVDDPSKVLVTLDGEKLTVNEPDGWTISADNRKVTVQGSACTTLQSGGDHKLLVQLKCEVVDPIL
jgi:hypothetical protein